MTRELHFHLDEGNPRLCESFLNFDTITSSSYSQGIGSNKKCSSDFVSDDENQFWVKNKNKALWLPVSESISRNRFLLCMLVFTLCYGDYRNNMTFHTTCMSSKSLFTPRMFTTNTQNSFQKITISIVLKGSVPPTNSLCMCPNWIREMCPNWIRGMCPLAS